MDKTQLTAGHEKLGEDREAGMMCTTGVQGVGKTYQNMHVIARYVKDKIATKVKGRKVLIYDTNGEYTAEQFAKAGLPNMQIKMIALKDVEAFGYSDLIEIRRIDAKHLGVGEKKQVLEYLLKKYRNGMLALEDINTYVLNVTHMEEVVGKIVNLRHRAVDVIVSYQSLRPVEPRIWQNSRWVRMHFQADDVRDIKDKVTNIQLFTIAQIMVHTKYYAGNQRFFLYITQFGRKIEGDFTKYEFMNACEIYLFMNKKELDMYKAINKCDDDVATEGQKQIYYNMYYDNPDRQENEKHLN